MGAGSIIHNKLNYTDNNKFWCITLKQAGCYLYNLNFQISYSFDIYFMKIIKIQAGIHILMYYIDNIDNVIITNINIFYIIYKILL